LGRCERHGAAGPSDRLVRVWLRRRSFARWRGLVEFKAAPGPDSDRWQSSARSATGPPRRLTSSMLFLGSSYPCAVTEGPVGAVFWEADRHWGNRLALRDRRDFPGSSRSEPSEPITWNSTQRVRREAARKRVHTTAKRIWHLAVQPPLRAVAYAADVVVSGTYSASI
jgi:hypothetical protein